MRSRIEEIDDSREAHVYEEDVSALKAHADLCGQVRATNTQAGSDFKHVASVPAVIVMKYIADNGITFADFMSDPKHADRMLNDPALAYFRTWEGKV